MENLLPRRINRRVVRGRRLTLVKEKPLEKAKVVKKMTKELTSKDMEIEEVQGF